MPSSSDFKYSTGDTTAWKNKYYALVDYLLSVGTSVAEIEAFLAGNSSFNPGTAPTALASLNAVTATTVDHLEYRITHATPYTSLTANLWFLVRMPSENAGAMTLKVDDLPAKAVYVGGEATTGGEFSAGALALLGYDSGADRFDALGIRTRKPVLEALTESVTWTNDGANLALVIGVAGGGGGARTSSGNPGNGGGDGSIFISLLDVSEIESATVTVGAGGAGATANDTDGNTGGSTVWSDGTHTMTANGGVRGRTTGMLSGATATGADVNMPGSGTNGREGKSGPFGRGGESQYSGGNYVGHNGTVHGGGGGGSRGVNGGDGAGGLVLVWRIY